MNLDIAVAQATATNSELAALRAQLESKERELGQRFITLKQLAGRRYGPIVTDLGWSVKAARRVARKAVDAAGNMPTEALPENSNAENATVISDGLAGTAESPAAVNLEDITSN